MSPLCTSLLSLSVCVWADRGSLPWFGFLRFVLRVHSLLISVRLSAAVAAAFSCVPRGQRALLDADMLELIDRSACLVEPVTVGVLCSSRACAVPAANTSSAASGRCSRMSPPRGLVEGVLLPSCSLRTAPVASLRLFVHPSSARLQLRGLGVTACTWVTVCFLSSVVHLTSCSRTKKTSPCSSSSDTVPFSTLFTLQRDVLPCFFDVLLHVLHLGSISLRLVWLIFFGYALLPYRVSWTE